MADVCRHHCIECNELYGGIILFTSSCFQKNNLPVNYEGTLEERPSSYYFLKQKQGASYLIQ